MKFFMYFTIETQSSKNRMLRLGEIKIYRGAFVKIWLVDFYLLIQIIYQTS